MKYFINILFCVSLLYAGDQYLYQDPAAGVHTRVDHLMSLMTLEEKVGQMCQYVGIEALKENQNMYKKYPSLDAKAGDTFADYEAFGYKDVEALVQQGLIGSFLHVHDEKEANYLQKLAQKSRLKIPLLIGTDAIHGHGLYFPGATIFPTPIGLASTWDAELVEKISAFTANEMRATGYHWTFSPNVDVARDGRWGRVGETFGEDPWLTGLMGAAMVKGYQGKGFSGPGNVIACAKHFVAGGEPPNGLNFAPMDVSERALREIWFPPFNMALQAGVFTFMAAHNEINGEPCHGNPWLLTEVLRDEWGFDGFVVSDWLDVSRLFSLHNVAENIDQANKQAVLAGIDMHMHGPGFLNSVVDRVQAGEISQQRIDAAVRKILYAKFQLGLFERPLVDEKNVARVVLHKSHQQLALQAALKSIVLLKNDNLLPLSKNIGSIFVTGPNADNQTILGDWSKIQPEHNVVTVREGIENVLGKDKVDFLHVGGILDIDQNHIRMARGRAKNANAAVVVVGEYSLRDNWNNRTCGENMARADINLVGKQLDLVKAVCAGGTPTIVVLVNGRPLSTQWIAENVPALIEAWEPGMLGGQAVADILFGDYNPGGRLPVTIPRSVGHIMTVYNHKKAHYFRQYPFASVGPLFPFGFGLSYTTYHYSGLSMPDTVSAGRDVPISLTVTNSGQMDGDHTVILYVNDVYSSVTTPVKSLAAWRIVSLKAGESKSITLEIPAKRLGLYDRKLEFVYEPGDFELYAGDLTGRFYVK